MVFSSVEFLFVFLPFVLIVYFLIRKELRNTVLLLSSLFFYFWGEPKFIIIMFGSIIINYSCGILIYSVKKYKNTVLNRSALFMAVLLNLGVLFYFKYFDFTIETLNSLFHMSIELKNIVLPIGISFFTFQGMSYVLDLYMDKVAVQKNPLKIAFYISLFPQLIAGPIVRYSDITCQIDSRDTSIEKIDNGIKRFIVGLAKKAIIANSVGQVADSIFNLPYNESYPVTAWIGAVCYTIQIYYDFSGYSDMAIGLGKIFGFDFLENFNYPYISKTITEFWRRWHISLSTWFKDYLYIPLGGNRRGNVYIHLIIVFLATGIWHGASWNFIVWGLWHGLFLIVEKKTGVGRIQDLGSAKKIVGGGDFTYIQC